MNPPLTQEVSCNLGLADGSRWRIAALNDEAAAVVSQLGCAMQLPVTQDVNEPYHHGNMYRLLVRVDANTSVANCYVPLALKSDGVVVRILSPSENWGGPYVNLVRLSLVFARQTQTRGGILIHGALAERNGSGVILAAPGGMGKTTASNRLPAPWRSLCDDTTLVARDAQGKYWAHPWPTWSRFLDGGPGGTWNVPNAVPVKGIFVLAQAVEDHLERIGLGRAVSLLVECVGQASSLMPMGLFKEDIRALHMEQFNNLCALARVVPTHVLNISLTGAFWQEIEQAI